MLAAAAGKTPDGAAEPRPELGLELGDPCLELPDLPVETGEIDLTDGRALDRVRSIVHDVRDGKRHAPDTGHGQRIAARSGAVGILAQRPKRVAQARVVDQTRLRRSRAGAANRSTSIGYQALRGTRRPPRVQSCGSISMLGDPR